MDHLLKIDPHLLNTSDVGGDNKPLDIIEITTEDNNTGYGLGCC